MRSKKTKTPIETLQVMEAELTFTRLMMLKALDKDFVPHDVLIRALQDYADVRDAKTQEELTRIRTDKERAK
jgi:hypothetical protein